MRSLTIAAKKIYAVKHLLLGCLVLITFMASAQQKTITGTVKSSDDKLPVNRASVQVKGSSIGTTTDEKGNYSIRAADNQSLLISAVGYTPLEIKIGTKTVINAELVSTNKELEGVVVTALGIKRDEKALGYSTTTIKGEQLTDAVSGNWTDALSGKVAGLNLIRSGGGPTASSKIILRGESDITGDNEALIVVDGVVINQGSGRRTGIKGEDVYGVGSDNMPADYGTGLNDINPEDIESVTILKGPNAAALYGERGAHGAVMITTKSGSSKKKKGLGVTLNSNASMEQVNRWPELQYEYGQGLGGANYYSYGAGPDGASTSGTSSAYGPRFDGQMFYQYDPVTQKVGTQRTPWIAYPDMGKDFFTTGKTLTNSITLDGGTDKTTARFSFTNVHNDWIIPNTGYKRNTVAMSVNSKINDRLQIASKVNYTNKWSDNLPGNGYGNQSIMYWYIFWQPNADVNWLRNYWKLGQEQKAIQFPFSSFPENPYAIVNEFINSTNRHGVTGNFSATYSFSKDLSLMVRSSLDMSYDQRAQKRPYDAGSRYQKGSYRTQNIFSQEVSTDFLLKYAKKFKEDFDFSATVGGSSLRNNYNRDEVRADSLAYPGLYQMSNAAGQLVTIPFKSKFAINSLYALITFGYKDYLFADFTGRQDWNSTLATPERTDNAGFFYPSVNLSFIASEVMKLPKAFDYLKLRFSVATVSGGTTVPYRTSYAYTAPTSGTGGLQNPTLLANPDLQFQRTSSYEFGTTIRLFKNRVDIDAAIYTGNTRNQILQRTIDRASGYSQYVINLGKVANRGFELAVNGTPFSTKSGFKWKTGITFSTNTNEIKKLPDSSIVIQTGPVAGGQIVAKVGGSLGDLYGRGYVRSPDGQVVYDATTGFAKITDDVVYLGNTIPKWKLSFSNGFSFKQFNLNFLFDAQYGGVGHSLMNYKMVEQGKLKSTLPGRYNGIIGNGVVLGTDGKYYPNTTIATNIDEYYRSHMGADNAEGSTFSTNFIKFREARLDYTLTPKLTKKLGLQKLTLGVYGRDLFIWSDWPMFDPEFGTLTGSDIVRGFEIGQFPSSRTMGVNLLIGF
jgi:TonB-linked SusC/RagA family outer membrane protein